MTKTKLALTAAFMILLLGTAFAQDLNAMSAEEIQAYIQQQVAAQAVQQTQPQVITVQPSQELSERLNAIQAIVTDLKTDMARMQDRFNTLSDNTESLMQNHADRVIQSGNEDRQAQFNDNRKLMMDYINTVTNPVRTNLPIIGVLLISAGAFLLWAGKQYKLTEGARHPAGLAEPNTLYPAGHRRGTGKLPEGKKLEEKPAEKEPTLQGTGEPKKPKKKWLKLPVKPLEPSKALITEEEKIMQASLSVSTRIKLLKQLEKEKAELLKQLEGEQ